MSAIEKTETRYQVLDRPPSRISDVVLRWETILVLLLGAVIIFNTSISPYFLDLYNLADATYNFSEKALMALPMALLILVREIDLSVGAIIAVAALAIGLMGISGMGRSFFSRRVSVSGFCAGCSMVYL